MLHGLQRFIIILNNPFSLVVQHSWFSLRLYAEKSTCTYMDICMENQLQPSPTPTSSGCLWNQQMIKPYKHRSATVYWKWIRGGKNNFKLKKNWILRWHLFQMYGLFLILGCLFFANCCWDLDTTCPLLLCGKGEAAHQYYQYTDQYTVTQKCIITLK